MTYQPVHIDGRTLVVIRQTKFRFESIESGRLSFDGTGLWLQNEAGVRLVTDAEIDRFKLVTPTNKIKPCSGFDLFLIVE